MNKKWNQYIFCITVQLLLPLLPLLLEFILTGTVNDETWALIAAMYVISIGISTKHLSILGLSIAISMLFVCSFGFIKSGNSPQIDITSTASLISIIAFFIIHLIERFYRHIKGDELFIDFGGRDV